MIEGRLAAGMADKDLSPVVYVGLNREESHRTGSVILHELYFDQFGGAGNAGDDVKSALAASYSFLDAWEAEFRRTALSISVGAGWTILAWNRPTRSLHNYWVLDQTNGPVTGAPLLVLTLYEHAFHMD